MTRYVFEEASAGSAVGTTIGNGARGQTTTRPRRIPRIAVLGSASAGDAAVDAFIGNQFIGRYYNTTAGSNVAPVEAKDWQPFLSPGLVSTPGEAIVLQIADAGATNILKVFIEDEEVA